MVRSESGWLVVAFAAASVAAGAAGCGRGRPSAPADGARPVAADAVPAEPWSDAWLAREGERYLGDPAHRRAMLVASLTNPENFYSRQRLGAYGLETRGWDVLPEWNPRSRPLTGEVAAALERGEPPVVSKLTPVLWDGQRPATAAAWRELGRRVFFEYPLRAEAFLEYGLTRRQLLDAVGIERTPDGAVPGVVVFADVDGETRVGITCALCHSTVREGALVVGAARRRLDYGRLGLAYDAATGKNLDPELARRMATWGPGRADVTEDDDEDPVAIPDLWGLRHEAVLTQAGTIQHVGPAALAIRQETQLLHANHQRIRPPRELAWALAMFLYGLEPPPARPPADPALAARGQALFAAHCRGCHDNAAHGGAPVAAARVGTDPSLANGRARGTGTYRVAPLVRVGDAAPYLHDGTVASLEELLSPGRKVPGHAAGTTLPAGDRAALAAFLRTL